MKYFNPGTHNLLLSAVYFTLTCALATWAIVSYHNLSAATSYIVLIGGLCASLGIATVALITRPSHQPLDDLHPTLSLNTQRSLRAVGLLLPIPLIAFSGTVISCLATTDNTPTKIEYKLSVSKLEEQVIGKSLVVEYGRLGPWKTEAQPNNQQESQPQTQEPDYSFYIRDVQRRCKRAWFPPRSHQWNQAKTQFTISGDGQVSNVRLSQSCGINLGDQSAVRAVENAAPFRPLPKGSPASVVMEMTFTYNTTN